MAHSHHPDSELHIPHARLRLRNSLAATAMFFLNLVPIVNMTVDAKNWYAATHESRNEKAMSDFATQMIGKKVVVSCAHLGSDLGYSNNRLGFSNEPVPTGYIGIDSSVCAGILRELKAPETSTILRSMKGFDFMILAHELTHNRGVHDETTATCEGVASLDEMLLRAGLEQTHIDEIHGYAIDAAQMHQRDRGLPLCK